MMEKIIHTGNGLDEATPVAVQYNYKATKEIVFLYWPKRPIIDNGFAVAGFRLKPKKVKP